MQMEKKHKNKTFSSHFLNFTTHNLTFKLIPYVQKIRNAFNVHI